MQAFENFITAAKSGGGENLNGDMAELGILQSQTGYILPGFPSSTSETKEPIQTRAALAFLLSDKGNFFREFLLDEVRAAGVDFSVCYVLPFIHINICALIMYTRKLLHKQTCQKCKLLPVHVFLLFSSLSFIHSS